MIDQSKLNGATIRSFSPWVDRYLLSKFVRRQVQARYQGTVLGIFWSLLSPLLMLAVYSVVFRVIFKMRWGSGEENNLDFALQLFAGLVVFNFFAETVLRAPNLLLEQPNLVKKVRFPLEILAWINVGSSLMFMLPGLTLLLCCVAYSIGIFWSWCALPIIWLPLVIWLLGLSWFLSAIGIFVRDIGQMLGLAVSVLQFLSPIFYPISALPSWLQNWVALNPLSEVVEQTRAALFLGVWPSLMPWLMEMGASLVMASAGIWVFTRLRSGFADVL